jgi:hypothetical protein
MCEREIERLHKIEIGANARDLLNEQCEALIWEKRVEYKCKYRGRYGNCLIGRRHYCDSPDLCVERVSYE